MILCRQIDDCILCLKIYCFSKLTIVKIMQEAPEKFEGLYQPVLLLSRGTSRKSTALKEWQIRSEKLFPGSALAKFCRLCTDNKYLKNHPDKTSWLFVRCFKKAGFSYDILNEQSQLTVTEKQVLAYKDFNGQEIKVGHKINVLSPAWYYGDKIIEHGLSGELV